MSSSFVFPYGIVLREEGIIETLPVAEVAFKNKKGEWYSLFLIIDSGATISALPKSDAEAFGVEVEKGKPLFLSGIGGEKLMGWVHKITAQLGKKVLQLPLVFINNEQSPRVLGREGVFEFFTVVFEEQHKKSGFLGKGTKEAKLVSRVLDSI